MTHTRTHIKPIIVYVSIGNSDNKLTRKEWARFVADVGVVLEGYGGTIHGRWHSYPAQPFENACWCVEFQRHQQADGAKADLAHVCMCYRQDSIAWAVADTEFIAAAPAKPFPSKEWHEKVLPHEIDASQPEPGPRLADVERLPRYEAQVEILNASCANTVYHQQEPDGDWLSRTEVMALWRTSEGTP